jgi:hypothetical protein
VGVRFFAGDWADAYLQRQPPSPGGPLPDAVFTNAPTLSAEDLAAQLARLRHHLE